MVTHCRQPEMANNKEIQRKETGTRETQSCRCRDLEPVFAYHNADTPTSNSKHGIKTHVSENYTHVYPHTPMWEYLHRCSTAHQGWRKSQRCSPFPKSARKFAAFETAYFANCVRSRSLLSFCSKTKAGRLTNWSSFDLAILQVPYITPENQTKPPLLLPCTEKMELVGGVTACSSSHWN